MDIKIRSATAEDEKEVVALWRICGLVVSYNDPSEDFCRACAKENSDILVGVDGKNRVVGSVMVGHDGHRGWVYYVAADPAHQKQGIGRKMVAAAESWLRERKIPKIMLMIRETNASVVSFY